MEETTKGACDFAMTCQDIRDEAAVMEKASKDVEKHNLDQLKNDAAKRRRHLDEAGGVKTSTDPSSGLKAKDFEGI